MKKFLALLTLMILLSLNTTNVFAENSFLDTSNIENGVIGVTYQGETGIRYKVIISKGSEKYYYDYLGPETAVYPLQLGNGKYEILLLKNLSGTKYTVVNSETVHINISNENVVYLQSIQNIHFKPDMRVILKASELSEGLDNNKDKMEAIYQYIFSSISYDYKKTLTLDKPYIPEIEDIDTTKKGICYDYASLFAAMLRTQGIPAKLVKGYSDNIDGYHAWNEVYIDGNWVSMDICYDVTTNSVEEEMIKDNSQYHSERYY